MSVRLISAWRGVRAMLHSVHDPPDAASVHAQFDRLVEPVADKLPKVADHLEAARDDVLAFTALSITDTIPEATTPPAISA